jgi:RNA polymerase sigma-70 factor (ECF subfamily)
MDKERKIFSGIYDQYIDKIYRFIFLKVSSQEITQDLTSETFLRGWEAFQRSQSPNPGEMKIENMQAFLYQIARNLVTDFYREKGKTQIVSAENLRIVDPQANLEEKAEFSSDFEQIKAHLADLKEDYQEVIILHYINDLSIKEIAKTINKPEGTIRVMIHRGLNALRAKLTNSN